jgi:hypothetical protein
MRSLSLAAVLICGCHAEPVFEVSLGRKPFEVRDAIFLSASVGPGVIAATTVVVFGGRAGLCKAFEDNRNICNAFNLPDVDDAALTLVARPIGVTEPLGWLMLRSATEGSAEVVPDASGRSTMGASLTEGVTPAVRTTRNRAVIERLVAGGDGAFSFESELRDGRAFRGRIDATWCPALGMFGRHNALLPGGIGASVVLNDANDVVGNRVEAQCLGEMMDARCTITSKTDASCTCTKAGITSTCATTPAVVEGLGSCCNVRFGD